MKRECLDFLADNPLYTKYFVYYVDQRCLSVSVQDVTRELHLDWCAVQTSDKQYKTAQLVRTGTPKPRGIGIDEISIRKGHTNRIVVNDLIRGQLIWFGGQYRSEANMA